MGRGMILLMYVSGSLCPFLPSCLIVSGQVEALLGDFEKQTKDAQNITEVRGLNINNTLSTHEPGPTKITLLLSRLKRRENT